MSELLPLSKKDSRYSLSISLRGSLAGHYNELLLVRDKMACSAFIRDLLFSSNPDLVRLQKGELLVIGRISEKGRYFPDW